MSLAPEPVRPDGRISPGILAAARRLEISARAQLRSDPGGARALSRAGRGLELHSTRPHERGDDARRIHWRVSARKGRLHVIQTREDRSGIVLVMLDVSPSMAVPWTGGVGKARELAAVVSLAALEAGDQVGLIRFGAGSVDVVEPDSGPDQASRILVELQRPHRGGGPTDPSEALTSASRLAPPGASLFIVSDLIHPAERGEGIASRLRAAAERFELSVLVFRPFDAWQDLPGGLLRIRDPESGSLQVLAPCRSARGAGRSADRLFAALARSGAAVERYGAHDECAVVLRRLEARRRGTA